MYSMVITFETQAAEAYSFAKDEKIIAQFRSAKNFHDLFFTLHSHLSTSFLKTANSTSFAQPTPDSTWSKGHLELLLGELRVFFQEILQYNL